MAEFNEISYEALEGELGELGEEESSQFPAAESEEENSSEDEPLPMAPPGSASAYFNGPSVSDIFPQKPKRLRRGKTFGKTLPTYINEPLTLAYEAFARDDLDTAAALLSTCAKLAPRLPDPYYTMALMHEQQGNIKAAAMMYFLAATLSSPKAIEIWRTVFDISVRVGNYHQAVISINRLLKRKPCYEYFCLKLKLYLVYLRDEKKAVSLLKLVVLKYPSYDRIHVDFGDICLEALFYDRAITHYMKFVYSVTGTTLVETSRLEHFKIQSQQDARLLEDPSHLELLFRACSRTADVLLEIGSPLAYVDCVSVTESVLQYAERLRHLNQSRDDLVASIPVDIILMNATARLYRNASSDVYLACRRAVPLLEKWEASVDTEPEVAMYLYRQRLRLLAALVARGMKSQSLQILERLTQDVRQSKLSPAALSRNLASAGDIYRECGEKERSRLCFEEAMAFDVGNSYAWAVYASLDDDQINDVSLLDRLNGRMQQLIEKYKQARYLNAEGRIGFLRADAAKTTFSSFTVEQLGYELRVVIASAFDLSV